MFLTDRMSTYVTVQLLAWLTSVCNGCIVAKL